MKKEELGAKRMYDSSAGFYHSERLNKNAESRFYHDLTMIPGMLKALGNVRGKKVLDWGCGTGLYAKELKKRGAKVKGFDISEEMIRIAKDENPGVDFRVGSGLKIPFNERFDIVFASLALHYLNDWDKALKEISRVLKKNGIFIFSSTNPVRRMSSGHIEGDREYRLLGKKNYFAEGRVEAEWVLPDGRKVVIPFYHKTFGTIVKTIVRNNFEIVDYEDLRPVSKAKNLFPKLYDSFTTIPHFCIWRLRKK